MEKGENIQINYSSINSFEAFQSQFEVGTWVYLSRASLILALRISFCPARILTFHLFLASSETLDTTPSNEANCENLRDKY